MKYKRLKGFMAAVCFFSSFVLFTACGVRLVNAQTPNITLQPTNENVPVGNTAQLSVSASVSDGGVLSYQWYCNVINSTAGATPVGTDSPTLMLNATTVGMLYYYVVVKNTNNSVNGKAVVTVTSSVVTVSYIQSTANGIKILAIGNSFSQDAMTYMFDLLVQSGMPNNAITLVNAYIGGQSVYGHAVNAKNNSASYQKQIYTGSGSSSSSGHTLLSLITSDDWDVITLQQASPDSGKAATYNKSIGGGDYALDYLIDYVQTHATNPNVKLGWHMTWAYAANSTHANFPDYNSDQNYMYQQIVAANTSEIYDARIVNEKIFDYFIPSGTAIQNARLRLGDIMCRDGYHLSNLGRYIAAATWVRTITGFDISGLTVPYSKAGINTENFNAIVQSVNYAIITPFGTTA